MKILYNIPSVIEHAGTERVLANKANYLADKMGADVVIVTREQRGIPLSFSFSDKIHFIDLGINYSDYTKIFFMGKRIGRFLCKRRHRKALERILLEERPDITISMMLGKEERWLWKYKDPSIKILEFHFCKPAIYPRHWMSFSRWLKFWGLLKAIRESDRFVVLTETDKSLWHEVRNITVIPNALATLPLESASLEVHRVLSVGRLMNEKRFDHLIDIWRMIHDRYPSWKLSIIGEGAERDSLQQQICDLDLEDSVEILQNGSDVVEEYMNSSIFVLSSRAEGFSMVLAEAMSCGVPVISYACPCGPSEIIKDKVDGFLIEDGNKEAFAGKLSLLIENENLRKEMGRMAKQNICRFNEKDVMKKWEELFALVLSKHQ